MTSIIFSTLSQSFALYASFKADIIHSSVSDKKSFKELFSGLISNENSRLKMWEDSVTDLNENYLLSNVNKQRLEILKQLL